MTHPSLTDLFETYFDIVPADEDRMLEKVYRLRHQVYCEELGFEANRTNQLEQDEADKHSIHCLLLHKPTQTYVGCVRLILADSAPEVSFPFEKVCGPSLRWVFDKSAGTGRKRYGEISRLAITSNFRRPRNDVHTANGSIEKLDMKDDDARRLFPSIALGLYMAITAMGLSRGLDGVFAMMEPRLARQLHGFGIHFQQVGDAVQHRGTRVPYYISRNSLLDNLKLECQNLLSKIQACLTLPQVQWS
jgi:N-acyl amino acid synthase of PEP-CTERM/exosortase system